MSDAPGSGPAQRSALLIEAELLGQVEGNVIDPDPAAVPFLKRMHSAGVALMVFAVPAGEDSQVAAAWAKRGVSLEAAMPFDLRAPGPRVKALMQILRASAIDVFSSWLVASDASVIPAAAQAGMAGVILVGADAPPGDHGLVVNRADSIADLPRVLIPRNGGCWHQR